MPDFDLRLSPTLQRELPQLTATFDEQAMGVYLWQALGGVASADKVLEGCEIEQATYLPGHGCLLRYLLVVRDSASGQLYERLVSGRLFADRRRSEAYLRDQLLPLVERLHADLAVVPFARPVAALDALPMALAAFPIDAEIPTLSIVNDPQHMAEVLGTTLPAALEGGSSIERCRVELVDYGRERRCTLRYHIDTRASDGTPQHQLVYGKLTADGSGVLAQPLSAALRECVQSIPRQEQFAVPRVYAWLPELQLSLLEAIPGEPALVGLLKAQLRGTATPPELHRLAALIADCARMAAVLHSSGLRLGPERTLDADMAVIRQDLAHIERLSPELGHELQRALERLEELAARSTPLDLCLNHGDFTHSQILFAGQTRGLVDFDPICQAEPALDLAHFLVYLRLAGRKKRKDAAPEATAGIDRLAEQFLSSYIQAAGSRLQDESQLRERVAVHKIANLLRRAVRGWFKFKPGRVDDALQIIREEFAGLDAA